MYIYRNGYIEGEKEKEQSEWDMFAHGICVHSKNCNACIIAIYNRASKSVRLGHPASTPNKLVHTKSSSTALHLHCTATAKHLSLQTLTLNFKLFYNCVYTFWYYIVVSDLYTNAMYQNVNFWIDTTLGDRAPSISIYIYIQSARVKEICLLLCLCWVRVRFCICLYVSCTYSASQPFWENSKMCNNGCWQNIIRNCGLNTAVLVYKHIYV